jgi:hypothetical protein
MTARYVIWSNEHAAWWGPDERGYTSIVEEAGRYDLAQARAIIDKATVGGLLPKVPRGSYLRYGTVDTVNEVLMMAPESVNDMLAYVGDKLANPARAGRFEELLGAEHEQFDQRGELLASVVEYMNAPSSTLAEPTTAEVAAEKRSADI